MLGKPAPPGPNGNPDVDVSGAVCGPSSYVCCHVAFFLVGVEGGVNPSASVVSSQTGNALMPDSGEVIGAERERFIIAEWARVCLPLLGRGTATALEDAGVGVPGAAGRWRRRASLPEGLVSFGVEGTGTVTAALAAGSAVTGREALLSVSESELTINGSNMFDFESLLAKERPSACEVVCVD